MEKKLLLLGILRRREMHTYRLYEFIERDLATCTDLKKPTAYYILNKMAEDGWVEEEITQAGNRPQRKVYHLTAEGENAFQHMLRDSLSSYLPAPFPGDAGLAFLDAIEREEAFDLLSQRRREMARALKEIQAVPRHHGSLQLTIEHQTHHLKSELAWLDGVLARLSEENSGT